MADSIRDKITAVSPEDAVSARRNVSPLRLLLVVLALGVAAVCAMLVIAHLDSEIEIPPDGPPILVESTLGQLALWMAEQSALESPEAWLGQVAKNWASSLGVPALDPPVVLGAARVLTLGFTGALTVLAAVGAVSLALNLPWTRPVLLAVLIGLDILLFIIPALDGDNTLPLLLGGIFLLLIVLFFAPGRVSKFLGFMVILSALLMGWEAAKAFGAATDYGVRLPQAGWTHRAYSTLEDTLSALSSGETVDAVILDENDVEDLVPPYPEGGTDLSAFPYPDLRLLTTIQPQTQVLGLFVKPDLPGRLVVVARAEDAARWTAIDQLVGVSLGTLEGDFADTNFLSQPRNLVLLDLKITNNLNMPHLQTIAEALLQPARRQGPVLLARILGEAALFTWSEAAVGFVSGALLGFLLGTLFAHSRLMSRGLLPYVVASQTVPILAIAPIVVLWLGAGPAAVAVISAYLTFFPVTINTLRGLTSPQPTALELMRSYAANPWTIMWKLRFPAALPYIFTALKVSATASVVGAVIGELPSGIRNGLGGAILNFNQYYTSDPAKLWAAILISALVGIAFFLLIGLLERLVLRGKVQGI